MESLEQTVRRNDELAAQKDNLKFKIFSVTFIVSLVFVIISVMGMLLSNFNSAGLPSGIAGAVIFGITAVISFIFKDNARIEYDYIIDGEAETMTVAKIRNLEKRKEVLNIKVSSFKRIEAYSKERFDTIEAKKLDFSLNEGAKKILFAESNSEMIAICFEPNDSLLSIIEKVLK